MTTPTKLTICNGVMRLLKETPLTQSELTNSSREPARVFNSAWDDGAIDSALEAGQWRFAKRTVMIDSSASVEPDDEFGGFQYAFSKPSDFIRSCGVWTDGSQSSPLRDYREEAGFWVANIDPIFVSYVSNGSQYGGDYSLWPRSFLRFVQAHIAAEIAGPMTSAGKELIALRKLRLREAISTDAMSEPTRFPAVGSWVAARRMGLSRENG